MIGFSYLIYQLIHGSAPDPGSSEGGSTLITPGSRGNNSLASYIYNGTSNTLSSIYHGTYNVSAYVYHSVSDTVYNSVRWFGRTIHFTHSEFLPPRTGTVSGSTVQAAQDLSSPTSSVLSDKTVTTSKQVIAEVSNVLSTESLFNYYRGQHLGIYTKFYKPCDIITAFETTRLDHLPPLPFTAKDLCDRLPVLTRFFSLGRDFAFTEHGIVILFPSDIQDLIMNTSEG